MIRTFTVTGATIPKYYFVKGTTTDGVVSLSDANTAKLLGISNLGAASGEAIDVCLPGEQTWLKLGGSVNAGDPLMSETDGTGIVATGMNNQGAVALENGASGDIIEVIVTRLTTF